MTSPLPALLGGPPVRPQGPPPWPVSDEAVRAALLSAWEEGSWGKYDGGLVQRLEAALAEYHDVSYALTCGSGTFAVELALRGLGIGPGHEVILSAYDYPGNFLSIHAVGAHPVLVDIAPDNCNVAVELLAKAVTATTKAILVSHLHGGVVPMREVMNVAACKGIYVIEDACQCPGAMVEGRRAGAWGQVGVLSFGGSKLLTAGRGGAVLTQREDFHQRMRTAQLRGNVVCPLSELQAAVLLPQLMQLDERNRQRAAAVAELAELLADIPGLRLFASLSGEEVGVPGLASNPSPTPPRSGEGQEVSAPPPRFGEGVGGRGPAPEEASPSGSVPPPLPLRERGDAPTLPSYYKLGFQYDAEAFGLTRRQFVCALRAEGIAFDEGFRSLHVGRSPRRYRAGSSLVEATRAHDGVVILHHPVLLGTRSDLEDIRLALHKVHAHAAEIRQLHSSELPS